ncbi:hypothetical protein ACOI1H_14725 [Loktanella sp. DJP18]|uniref:hypothetical protein n=1 Tax=Loktanella sp. DJP18 TaxID=3409788 RepID=UPI003BB76FFA
MFTTKVAFDVNIGHPQMLADIKALSPAFSELTVFKGIRDILKKDRPDLCDIQVCRQVAKAAIAQGIVHLLPPAPVHNAIVAAAPHCGTIDALVRAAIDAYKAHGVVWPSLIHLRGLLKDMVALGDLTLSSDRSAEADAPRIDLDIPTAGAAQDIATTMSKVRCSEDS